MHRSYRRFTRSDRYQLEKFLASGKSKSWIADQMGFHRATIYREFSRSKTRDETYTGLEASRKAKDRYCARFIDDWRGGYKIKGWVSDLISIKLNERWSPQQISQRLKLEKNISVSHEAIYKFILSSQKRGGELHKCLRHFGRRKRRFKRRSRYWELQHQRRKSIEARPVGANQRIEVGHLERDLMLGLRGTGAVLAVVDRKTRYTLLAKVDTTFADIVNEKTYSICAKSRLKVRSMTNDNGHEFGQFWKLEKKMNAPVYFTHPLCPWERGTVENTIGLVRQYLPKRTDLSTVTEDELLEVQNALNSRPRRSLNYLTPDEVRSGKRRKLITQKRIEEPPPEYYEKYYLPEAEIRLRFFS